MSLFAETANAWGLPLSQEQIHQFALYNAELRRWNEQINLTAITEPDAIDLRHFLDSLSVALVWGDAPRSLIDIGTGAGFPGLPLKILRPTLELTLVESVAKKTNFLHHMINALGLPEVNILPLRAEEVGRNKQHRERYDVAVARAVADLRVLAEYCLPLCRSGGHFIAPKGHDIQQEVEVAQSAFAKLGGKLQTIYPVQLPGMEPRHLVVVEKWTDTPPLYPRANGVPSRRPLA